ncbi:MAG: L-threonylcarbamoyladenylate synthase [Rikenellaceae bacterium]
MIDREYLEQVVELLKKGGIILYPTDTVWGIGCDATNSEAVAKIYALKKRCETKSMITLMDSLDRVTLFFNDLPTVAYDLMELSEKPLTLILDGPKNIASNLISEDNTLAVRVADHEFCKTVCRKLMRPLVSTSANISGEATPKKFDEISEAIKNGVDLVVEKKYEKGATGKPSSIIKLSNNYSVTIIRE